MYTHFARWYDLHYGTIKDYPGEAAQIAAILESLDPIPERVLDVGCGTGEHARLLAEEHGFQVDGIDLDPNLTAIAQKKVPSGDFTVADMRSFSLPKKYDAVTCLFSSIGYVETNEGLEATLASISRALAPGGWLMIEPWVEPSEWSPTDLDATESHDPTTGTHILQARQGQTEGNVSVITIDYHIEAPDASHSFTEVHRLGLFTRKEMEAALKKCHFQARYVPKGELAQALYIACFTP